MRQTIDDFVKTNKKSSSKRQSLDEFVGQRYKKEHEAAVKKFGEPSNNFMESPRMQQISSIQNEIPPQELQSPAHNNVPKSSKSKKKWNGIIDNPIGRGVGKGLKAVDVLSQDIAKYATPDAPMFTKDGKLDPNMTARQQFMQDNPQKSTGNKKVDSVLNVGGGIGSIFVPVGTGGAFINDISKGASALIGTKLGAKLENSAGKLASKGVNAVNPTLNNAGINISTNLANKAGQAALKGGALGAGFGALEPLRTGEGNLNDIPKSVVENSAMFAGGDAVLPFLGAGFKGILSKITERAKTVAPEVEQATQRTLSTYSKPVTNPQPLDHVMTDITQEVSNRITPPLESPKLLDKYLQNHLGDVPKSEIDSLTFVEKAELAKHIQENPSIQHEIAVKVAKEKGHDWDSLTGNKINVVDNVVLLKEVAPIEPTIQPVQPRQTIDEFVSTKQNVEPVKDVVSKTEVIQQPRTTTVLPDTKIKGQQLKDLKTGDETGFANTVKNSEYTDPALKKALETEPVTGARTTDVLNRQDANKIINKHGLEGTHDVLMAKTKQFSAAENTAAQIVAKHLSSLGGEENLRKAINLVSKTAKGGREMGQAIQALTQWNKLDETGALMLGERQLNKGVKNTEDWKSLSVEQGAPITEAAQRYGAAAETKSLADEVLSIVTNKADGVALTEAEKATIKQFQDQVKLINEKGKAILAKPKVEKVVDKANEKIREVSQIEPKARTRDQVVSFLDAKADKARKRLAASRNLGFAANSNNGNPVVDMAIIGAAKIAKGVVKLSDFTEAMIKDFGETVRPHINEAFNRATNIFRKENGLPTVEHLDRVVNAAVKNERFTAEDAKQFKAWASEIGHMSEEFKREATQDLQAAMKELGDSTLGDKIATLQTGAQLLNVVTIGRNAIGNGALIVSEKISKLSAVPIDWTLSKLTGERTIQFNAQNQEKLIKNFIEGTESGWKGVSPTGTLDSYGIHPNVFGKKNPLRYVSKSLGASMQGFDNAAYRQAYGDVLATYGEQMGKAQGLTKEEIKSGMAGLIEKLDKRVFELADEAGLYATFQDETLLSQGAEMLKRGLNKITDLPMQKIVDKGLLPQKYSTEGFGLGDVVLKYAKTPANLIMRAIDYSPLGFIRGIGELAPLVFNKAKFNQFQATRSLSRAITGTLGLTGVGYMLADAGILTGSSSLDKDTRSIQEQSGQGAYKVNWSALKRYITSGLDKEAAKYQKGDHLMDYQWLQPAAISVAMGVNANRAVKDKKEGADITGWKIAEKALLGGLQTILENPMVQGLSGVVDAGGDILKRQDPTKAKSLLKGVPATFVPTLLNQWRASTDNKQRETFSKNLLTEMGNLIKNKIPGASKSLPVSYDSLGNARERIQGGKENTAGQYLTAFFSPARMTEYQVSDEAKLVLDLMDKSGDSSVLPRIGNKYFKVKQGKNLPDLKVNLDAKQFSALQKNLGEMVNEALGKKALYLSNPNISLEHKVDAVKKILTDVGAKARENIGTQMGYKKKDIKS